MKKLIVLFSLVTLISGVAYGMELDGWVCHNPKSGWVQVRTNDCLKQWISDGKPLNRRYTKLVRKEKMTEEEARTEMLKNMQAIEKYK